MPWLAIALALASQTAEPFPQLLGPRELALGGSTVANAFGSAAARLNPAGAALGHVYVIEGAAGLGPSDDGKSGSLSICDSTKATISACLAYDYFVSQPKSGEPDQHQTALTLAIALGQNLFVGATGKWIRQTTPDDELRKAYFLDAGTLLRLSDMISLGAAGTNLASSTDTEHRQVASGMTFFLQPTLTVSGSGQWDTVDGVARYACGFEYLVSAAEAAYPIRVGYVQEERSGAKLVTFGLGYVTPRMALDVGMSKVVREGDELTLQVALRLFVPE